MSRLTFLAAAAFALTMSGCDVDQTREAKLPDVDVEGGQAPAYDVDAPDVDVNTEERTVTVPDVDVDVNKQERTVTVPDVDIKRADADEEGRDSG
jgi:uncharacterized lipoprotein